MNRTLGPLTHEQLEQELRNLREKLEKSERISWSRYHKYQQAASEAEGWRYLGQDLNMPIKCPYCLADVWFSAEEVFYCSDENRTSEAVDSCFICEAPIRLVITPVLAHNEGLMPRDRAIQLAREWEIFVAESKERQRANEAVPQEP